MTDLQLLGSFLLVGCICGVIGFAIGMAMGRRRLRSGNVYVPKYEGDAPF